MLDRSLLDTARRRQARVVLPEGDDERILLAARRLLDEGLARPQIIADSAALDALAGRLGVDTGGIETLTAGDDPQAVELAARYREGRPKASERMALGALRRPLFHAALRVAAGHADAMVAGAANPTARVIEAGLMCVGLAEGIRTPSSFFLMRLDADHPLGPRQLLFADCAVVMAPDPGELADIAIASAASAERVLGEPARVAMLSFSTHGSARHAHVDRVTEALALVRHRAPGMAIDGEMQVDAALDPGVARKKLGADSSVAGQANVLVFPDLDAGNIGYKLVQYLGGAQAIGPILQGFARPVADLSRGASVEDIVQTTVLTVALGS